MPNNNDNNNNNDDNNIFNNNNNSNNSKNLLRLSKPLVLALHRLRIHPYRTITISRTLNMP